MHLHEADFGATASEDDPRSMLWPAFFVLLFLLLLLEVVPVGDAHFERALHALNVLANDVVFSGEFRRNLCIVLVELVCNKRALVASV